ncbi:MAG TPA: HesA/MoeB/ThiF family protein [Candidatus Dormibacteraeota bacterium]|jgi:adenylyltransferase/sulfurtransferase
MTDSRHHRQRILPEVGAAGQRRLQDASVLIVGLGALGSPVALYLAAAGVGRIGLLDDQRVELPNLNRQILYQDSDQGRPKVEAARDRLRALDPSVQLDAIVENFRPSNAGRLVPRYDLLVDGTDAFETKFLLNDAAILLDTPLVHGAALQWGGQVLTVLPGGPCLRCLFREPPDPGVVPSCEEAGILGAVTGVVGSVQAEEAIKILLGAGEPLRGRIFQHDALRAENRTVEFSRDPECPVCSRHPRIRDLARYAEQVSARGHVLV